MKFSIMLRISSLLSILYIATFCKPNDPEPFVAVEREDAKTIAETRQYNEHQVPTSIRITDPGMEGVFKLDAGDRTTPDNMGTVLVTVNGARYKRAFTGPGIATWFGVTTSDDDIGPELQNAVNAVDNLVIPDGSYTQQTTVRLRSEMTLQGNAGKVMITLPKTYVSLANAIDASIPLKNVVIDGLSWTVTTTETGTNKFGTIYIDSPSVTNLTVQNCSSSDVAARDSTNWFTLKIPAGKTADNIIVRNNSVQAKRMACEIFNHDNPSIYAGKNIQVSGNFFHDSWFGISLSGPLENLTVDNNHIKDCRHFGIEIAGAARGVKITNNKFEGVFDKFLEGSNDGGGNGSLVGGMEITGNSTIGTCTGGIQLFNGGAVTFAKNNFAMTGMLELFSSTKGGTFSENVIESSANKAVICDNSADHTFTGNTISNKNSSVNQATFMSYGSKAVNNTLTNNKIFKGRGGKYYDGVEGGTYKATMNYDESGNPLP
ncbi:right-handed parallel beta-helix repeat-containing protein [Spirosoma soli]|uniref:Right-handed parallel beta-helix repeat-containing protein n=1 Tax=Spirosoma soli TaxID=1770529 RepID=A0ABW5LYQ6_9BACT